MYICYIVTERNDYTTSVSRYVSRLPMCVRLVVNMLFGDRTVFCALIKAPIKASLTVVFELVSFPNVSRHSYQRLLTVSNPP